MFNHQDTKGTKKTKNIFGLVFQYQIFAFLGALVPIYFWKIKSGNRYYADRFKVFIEGRYGALVVKRKFL